MPVQCPEQVATLEEFGSPCVCGAENFERVVVERVLSRPVVTDLIACVECHCVYYSPLPRPALLPPPSNAPPMPAGVATNEPGLLRTWGGVPSGHPLSRQTAEDLRAIREAAARAGKGKKRSR